MRSWAASPRSAARCRGLEIGQRVGVRWLGHTCGVCPYCRMHRENLCDRPLFTGYTRDGGYAAAAVAEARYAFPLDERGTDVALAPLLCAGLIGWRALVMAGDGRRLGLYGFGAAAHIMAQVARWQGRSVFAFTRTGRLESQDFAAVSGCRLGGWLGGAAAGAARRGDHFRAGRRSRAACARARFAREGGSCAPEST